MNFQVFNLKDTHFLDLLDDDLNPIELSYIKERLWIKYFGHSNFLYMKAIRTIINHVLIGEYHFQFFPWKEFGC